MTEQHRTVALDRDMPRVREWIDQAVRHAVNEAAQALHSIRYWCDEADKRIREECIVQQLIDCDVHGEVHDLVTQVRSLLPALPETTERRAEHGEEVGDARHSSDPGRPGLVSPPAGGSETGGGYSP